MSHKAYPLDWPIGWKRTPVRRDGAFRVGGGKLGASGRRVELDDGVNRVYQTLQLMGIKEDTVTISSNVRPSLGSRPGSIQVQDPGVAVYWTDNQKQTRCMAIDQYVRVPDNLAAIAATLEAMRAIERHGGAEILDRAFTGFTALPAPEQPWQVLGVDRNATVDQIKAAHRKLVQSNHPAARCAPATGARWHASTPRATSCSRDARESALPQQSASPRVGQRPRASSGRRCAAITLSGRLEFEPIFSHCLVRRLRLRRG